MSAFMRFLSKELMEVRRTWRGPTVMGTLLFFGIMSPVAALAAPALVESVASSQPGVVIRIPDPTYVDSYLQWIKNLSQIGMLLVVFASGGLLANERASGTAALVVTKPVSRTSFVVAKYASQALLVTVATIAGTAVTAVGTLLAFGEAPASELVAASAAWLGGALVAVAVVEVFSAFAPTLAAGVAGLILWGLSGVAAMWGPAVRYTPVGLLTAPGRILTGENVPLLWPSLTAVLAVILLVALAAQLFARREL